MEYQYLDERDGVFIVMDKGKVITLTKDDYIDLKLKHYNGKRIFYEFSDGVKIQETYDDRIFNCYYDDVVLNIRDGNKIAQFIKDKNESGYIEYFKEVYLSNHREELLDSIIDTFGDRIRKVRSGYIIDDIFKVDKKGTSYFKTGLNNWKFLCTVAQGTIRKITVPTKIGLLELDSTCMTIVAKIGFFCNPNVEDSVFMNQLPKELQRTLKEEYGGV